MRGAPVHRSSDPPRGPGPLPPLDDIAQAEVVRALVKAARGADAAAGPDGSPVPTRVRVVGGNRKAAVHDERRPSHREALGEIRLGGEQRARGAELEHFRHDLEMDRARERPEPPDAARDFTLRGGGSNSARVREHDVPVAGVRGAPPHALDVPHLRGIGQVGALVQPQLERRRRPSRAGGRREPEHPGGDPPQAKPGPPRRARRSRPALPRDRGDHLTKMARRIASPSDVESLTK